MVCHGMSPIHQHQPMTLKRKKTKNPFSAETVQWPVETPCLLSRSMEVISTQSQVQMQPILTVTLRRLGSPEGWTILEID